jgi:hypothetical protein
MPEKCEPYLPWVSEGQVHEKNVIFSEFRSSLEFSQGVAKYEFTCTTKTPWFRSSMQFQICILTKQKQKNSA